MVKIENKFKIKEKIEWNTLGVFIVHLGFLERNDELLVKYGKSYAPSKRFKRQKVSPYFRDLLLNLFHTNKINYDLAKLLSKKEKQLFINLIFYSKADINLDKERLEYTDSELKQRYNLLLGQVDADNNNFKILEELKNDIIPDLIQRGIMEKSKGDIILKQVEEDLKI